MLNDGMLRHDPCATSPSIDSTIAGRWNASTSFDATMPITPRCQPSPATTITVREPIVEVGLDDLLRLRDDLRFFLLPPEVLGVRAARPARAPPRAIASSEASSSRAAMSGVLMRPAALTRGATTKPM